MRRDGNDCCYVSYARGTISTITDFEPPGGGHVSVYVIFACTGTDTDPVFGSPSTVIKLGRPGAFKSVQTPSAPSRGWWRSRWGTGSC